jgi:hypothetical protein
VTDLTYNVKADADVSDLNKAANSINEISETLEKAEKNTNKLTRQTEKATKAQEEMSKETRGLARSFGRLTSIDAAGFFLGITAAIVGGIKVSRDWALQVENTSQRLGASLEDAAALQASFALAGLDTEQALSAVNSVQSTLVDLLEEQAEGQKEIIQLDQERVSVLAEIQQAEQDHAATIADLQKEISEVGAGEVKARVKKQNEALKEVEKNYQDFLEDQRRDEQRQTRKLEEEWEDRVRAFNRSVLELQEDLAEESQNARSVRELKEIEKQFAKRKQRLDRDLSEEQRINKRAAENQQRDRETEAQRELRRMDERRQAIEAAAAEDIARIEANNAKRVAALEERIEKENTAWEKQQEGFQQDLIEINKAQAEAAKATGGFAFALEQLGVNVFDADGKLRPMIDIMWDIQQGIQNVDDQALRANLVSNLGLEDLTFWLNEGSGATESLGIAQANNLVPTQDAIQAIKDQNEQLALLQLQLTGAASKTFDMAEINKILVASMQKVNEAIVIVRDLYNQVTEIAFALGEELGNLWIQITEGVESIDSVLKSIGIDTTALMDVASSLSVFSGGLSPLDLAGTVTGVKPLSISIGQVFGVQDLESTIFGAMSMSNNQVARGGR